MERFFHQDIVDIINSYIYGYNFLEWIPEKKLIWDIVATLPNSKNMVLKNIEKIKSIHSLFDNYEYIDIIEQNITHFHSKKFWENCPNTDRIQNIINHYPEKVDWKSLSLNPNCVSILETHQDKINWINLSKNPSDRAAHILLQNIPKIDEYTIWENHNDIIVDYILSQPQKKWIPLSKNSNPRIIQFLEDGLNSRNIRPAQLNLSALCSNPKAINIIKYYHRIWENNTIYKSIICANSGMTELVLDREFFDLDDYFNFLHVNTDSRILDYLKTHKKSIDWKLLCGNPSIIKFYC